MSAQIWNPQRVSSKDHQGRRIREVEDGNHRDLMLAALDTIAWTENPKIKKMCKKTIDDVSEAPMRVASFEFSGRNLPRIVEMAWYGIGSPWNKN
ncbi:uncharacterized protein LDX57_001826 [Aspergillus melleus]|uniref:uncharacterized protein n=1 Tax=Aspergillus melleus TaxID=138277 RepID=UPI001E8CD0F9|nr:uncharacterized protein LDX57_001826 [Aspergillus melleus]KAH8424069.1 hypothetical protein LDX57_001826 [Aspergillus melleus]